jgi:hypothetical protein
MATGDWRCDHGDLDEVIEDLSKCKKDFGCLSFQL